MSNTYKNNPTKNPCLSNEFPAASIFKIVTAAAAIEKCGFNSETVLTYNGDKYTLYRSQLKERKNRYAHMMIKRYFSNYSAKIQPQLNKT